MLLGSNQKPKQNNNIQQATPTLKLSSLEYGSTEHFNISVQLSMWRNNQNNSSYRFRCNRKFRAHRPCQPIQHTSRTQRTSSTTGGSGWTSYQHRTHHALNPINARTHQSRSHRENIPGHCPNQMTSTNTWNTMAQATQSCAQLGNSQYPVRIRLLQGTLQHPQGTD